MRRQLASFLPMAALTWTLSAQSSGIQGTVLDPDERPIPGARVECAGRMAVTGADGRYSFPDAGRCQAVITATGFERLRVELAEGDEAPVKLKIAGLVERVVVTATRHETTAEEAGVAASVLEAADLAVRQYPAVPDLLRELPGLQVTTTGRRGGQTSLFTRGAQRTGTLVLIDGVPVNDPGGEFNLAHLTSADIDRVEVIRGPESALFGAEAASGVVQLFTRRGDVEQRPPMGSVSHEWGSFGSNSWQANLLGGTGSRADYALQTSRQQTSGEFANDGYRNVTGSANLGLRLSEATQIRGVVRITDAVTGVPGQVGYGLFDLDAKETNRDSSVSLRLDDVRGGNYAQQVSFAYHRMRDLYSDSQMQGPYAVAALVRDVLVPRPRTYLVRMLDPSQPLPATPPGMRLVTQDVTLYPMSEPFLSATSRKRAGYQGTLRGTGTVLVFGYDYERQEGEISASGVARDNHGLFLHGQRTLGGRLFLAGGIRTERSSAYGTKLAPRGAVGLQVAGQHGPLSSTFLRLSAGRGITEPSLLQNYARDPYFVGNPNLRPEKTASYEAGLAQEWFGRRVRTDVAVFQNSFSDLIAFVSLPPPVWGSWENLESSRARGLEMSGKARLSGSLIFAAAYTRLWTRVLRTGSAASPFYGEGQELARRPGNSGSLSLSYSPGRWWFTAGAVLVGERQDSDYVLGVTRNPGYQNVRIAASYRVSRHVSPFLRAENLLNSRYQEALGYSSLSRSITGGVRLEW
ncbi:MAG: TonB-dependent receptor domain-containing protein [Bryobacteraceae bacterium]